MLRPDDSRKFCSYLSQEGIEYEAYRPDIKNIDSSVIVARELGGIGRIVGYQDYVEFILAALKELDQLVVDGKVIQIDGQWVIRGDIFENPDASLLTETPDRTRGV